MLTTQKAISAITSTAVELGFHDKRDKGNLR